MELKRKWYNILWCLPQYLLSLLIRKVLRARFDRMYEGRKLFRFDRGIKRRWKWLMWVQDKFSGTALFDTLLPLDSGAKTIAHEHGHHVDGDKWGWLYLPIIGIASLRNNLESRKTGYTKLYYHKYPLLTFPILCFHLKKKDPRHQIHLCR